MKRRLMVALLATTGILANAQNSSVIFSPNASVQRHIRLVNGFMANQNSVFTGVNKPTGAEQRVLAQAIPLQSNVDLDSFSYKYSDYRSSAFNYDNMNLMFNIDFANENQSTYLSPQVQYKSVKADSIIHIFQGQLVDISATTYNQNNKIDSFKFFATNQFDRTFNTYTSLGNLKSVFKLNASGDTVQKIVYFYNAAETAIIADTSKSNSMDYARRYVYNAQNNLDSVIELQNVGTSFQPSLITTLTYTSSSKIQNMGTYVYAGSGNVTEVYLDSFAYEGNLEFSTFHESQTISLNSNDTFFNKEVKYIGANNLPDSMMTYYNPDTAYIHYGNLKFYYNEFNNPVKITFNNLFSSGESRFYYELMEDTTTAPTSVKFIDGKNVLNIFPNPIMDDIHINWTTGAVGIASINIYNNLGQNVFNTNMNLMNGDNKLNVGKMKTGNYVMVIRDKKGNVFSGKISRM